MDVAATGQTAAVYRFSLHGNGRGRLTKRTGTRSDFYSCAPGCVPPPQRFFVQQSSRSRRVSGLPVEVCGGTGGSPGAVRDVSAARQACSNKKFGFRPVGFAGLAGGETC